MKLEAGQKLFCVYSSYGGRKPTFSEVTVEKIGRKWAKIGYRNRMEIETGMIDGGDYSSPGCCYINQEEYEKERDLNEAWRKLTRQIYHPFQMPESMTHEKIKQIRELLELPESKEEA